MALKLSADGVNSDGIHTLRDLEVFAATCRRLGMPDGTSISAGITALKFLHLHSDMRNITASWPNIVTPPSDTPAGWPPADAAPVSPASETPTVRESFVPVAPPASEAPTLTDTPPVTDPPA